MHCLEANYAINEGNVYIDSYIGTCLLNTSRLTHFNPIIKIVGSRFRESISSISSNG